MKTLIFTILGMLIFCGFFAQDIQSQNKHTETCIEITSGGSSTILIESGKLYSLTIKSCKQSAWARIGTYLIYGLNISDPMTGGQPCVLMVAETSSIDWSFSYSLNGSYDANMTITSNGWGDQGLLAVLAELNCGPHVTINEPEINDLIKIYPNPVNNQIHIIVKNVKTATLNVYDVQGKIVYSEKIKNENSEIDFTSFSKGFYLFKIIDENGNILKAEKIVKK